MTSLVPDCAVSSKHAVSPGIETGSRQQKMEDEWRQGMSQPEWQRRSAFLAAWVPRSGCRVLDVGCYDGALRRFLPSGTHYIPLDKYPRPFPGFIACDLNAVAPPPLPSVDVIVAAGVLEFVRDLPRCLPWLATTGASTLLCTWRPDCPEARYSAVTFQHVVETAGWHCETIDTSSTPRWISFRFLKESVWSKEL